MLVLKHLQKCLCLSKKKYFKTSACTYAWSIYKVLVLMHKAFLDVLAPSLIIVNSTTVIHLSLKFLCPVFFCLCLVYTQHFSFIATLTSPSIKVSQSSQPANLILSVILGDSLLKSFVLNCPSFHHTIISTRARSIQPQYHPYGCMCTLVFFF